MRVYDEGGAPLFDISPHIKCTSCGEIKPTSAYDDKRQKCKRCRNKRRSAARSIERAENPEKWSAIDRQSHLRRNRKMTDSQFNEMLKRQGGRCAICGTDKPGKNTWAIDHDHRCCKNANKNCGACTRELLCHRCNAGLGQFQDNVKVMRAAITYLEKWGAT